MKWKSVTFIHSCSFHINIQKIGSRTGFLGEQGKGKHQSKGDRRSSLPTSHDQQWPSALRRSGIRCMHPWKSYYRSLKGKAENANILNLLGASSHFKFREYFGFKSLNSEPLSCQVIFTEWMILSKCIEWLSLDDRFILMMLPVCWAEDTVWWK